MWGVLSAKNSAAMHWCWPTAHLDQHQIFTGEFTVAHSCWEAEQWGALFTKKQFCAIVLSSQLEQQAV